MSGAFTRGLAAGAVGTTVLHAITYADMALRGRPESTTPKDVVETLADRTRRSLPGEGVEQENSAQGLGALAGIGTGVLVGALHSVLRSVGVRSSAPVSAVTVGAAAMAASDVPSALLGITDPRTWTAQEWTADVVPHLAYGIATHGTLRMLEGPALAPVRRARPALVARSLVLGVAAGGRSSLGLAAPVLLGVPRPGRRSPGTLARLTAAGTVVAEVTADKLPSTPSRVEPGVLPARLVSGATGGVTLARAEGANGALPAVVGAAGALAGSYGGVAWRRWAARRLPDWQAALLEDAVAAVLAVLACRPGRRTPGRAARVEVVVG